MSDNKIQDTKNNLQTSTAAALDTDDSGMSLVEHLTELRTILIKSIAAVILAACASLFFSNDIIKYISFNLSSVLRGEKLVFISPAEGFFVSLKVSFFVAFLAVLPYILFQIWKFIYIALTAKEKKYFNLLLITSVLSFYAGLVFAVYIAVPLGVNFLIGYSSELFRPMISVEAYYDFLIYSAVTFGIVFEMPLILLFLNKINIVSKKWLSENRRYSVLIIFILAAVFSPPDVFSQFLVAIPMLFLYELSIILIKIAGN
ncbi:MAG: twin-arginine translocase subunit TatC [Candidatus Wallbacteria bacterium]